jgi:hypothetical protein
MEASVAEQRLSRWAAFAAMVSFPEGMKYRRVGDDAMIQLNNVFKQPIMQLQVLLWEMEVSKDGKRHLRYSTMLESVPKDIDAEAGAFSVRLTPTIRLESERLQAGESALSLFRERFAGKVAQFALCVVTYVHRAQMDTAVFLYDLEPNSKGTKTET